MTKPIAENFDEIISSKSKDLVNDPTIMAFEKASAIFKELVDKGLVAKKKNNLMSREEAIRNAPVINQPLNFEKPSSVKYQFNIESSK